MKIQNIFYILKNQLPDCFLKIDLNIYLHSFYAIYICNAEMTLAFFLPATAHTTGNQ